MTIFYQWRGEFDNSEVNSLHAEGFSQRLARGRRGVGVRLIAVAVDQARAAGNAWLHVDFESNLRDFYLEACGFTSTHAGLIALSQAGQHVER